MRKEGFFAIILTIAILVASQTQSIPVAASAKNFLIVVPSDNASKTRYEIERRFADVDVLGIKKSVGEVHILGDLDLLLQLQAAGFGAKRADPTQERRILQRRDSGFRNLQQIEDDLKKLAAEHPDHVRLYSLMQEFRIPKTEKGHEIWALKISREVGERRDLPRIAFIGNHHAREIQTPEVVLDTAHWLIDGYGRDAKATAWVDQNEIWLVPVANPDGYEYVFSDDSMWRKNLGHGTGVDLNRNYPFHWGGCGSNSSDPDDETYRGSAAATEPEVQAIMALSEREKFWISVTYHSYGQEVLYPYVCANIPAAEMAIRDKITDEFSAAMGFGKRLASSEGEEFEWRYNQVGGLNFLVEVSDDFQPDFGSFVQNEIPQIRKGWFYLFDKLAEAPLAGLAVYRDSGEQNAAALNFSEVAFSEGERRLNDSRSGRFFWYLPDGPYTLNFEAQGYQPRAVRVNIGSHEARNLRVELTRAQ